MSLQIRRGTEAQRNTSTFVPLSGEPIWTTDEKKLYVGDGVTAGGIEISGSGGGSTVTDQALYTTSSVVFNNVTVTNTLTANKSIIMQGLSIDSQGAEEPGSLAYRIQALTSGDDLQINSWRYILLNPTEDVAISEFNPAASQLRVKTIKTISSATELTIDSALLVNSTATIGDIAGTNLSGVPTVRILDVLAVGSGAGPGNITSRGNTNLIITPGGNQLGGKIAVVAGESSGVVIGNHNDANIADFNTGTIQLNKQVNFGNTANLNTATFNGPVQFNSSVSGVPNPSTYTTALTFDSNGGNTGKAIFTASSYKQLVEIWNTDGSTGSANYSDIRFYRKRGDNTLTANNVIGAVNFDGFQTTNGYASDYAANRLFPGIRWAASGAWSSNQASTTAQIFNRVFYNANLPFPYNQTNSHSTDTTVMLSASFSSNAFQYSGNLSSFDIYQGFNAFAGTGTQAVLTSGVFGANRLGSIGGGGNQFQVRLGSAFGNASTFPSLPSLIQFKTRTDHIPYWAQGYGGLNTDAAGQVNWTAGSTATWSNYLAPSVVKGSRIDLNSTRYQQLERTVQRGTTIRTADALWNTSTQAGDVLGTVSFQGGLTGVSDGTLTEGSVDGVLIRAYAKNDWQGDHASTTTTVTYSNNQSALRIEVSTSTTIGPVAGSTGFSQLYKTVFEVDATTATFFTTDVAQAGVVQRNAYVTTATTETAVLAVIDTTVFAAAEYSVSIVDSGEIHFAKINIIGDGTDAWKTEYGINTSNGALGTFNITTGTNEVSLTFTPSSATAMKIRVQGTYFTQ